MKIVVLDIYGDGDDFILCLDEGQDFPALLKEWKKQDDLMIESGDDTNWLGVSDFMRSKGVQVVEYKTLDVP